MGPGQRRPHVHHAGRAGCRSGNFFLNVPLPTNENLPNDETNPDAGQYYTVTFSFMSGSKGTYAWNCEFPCGQMVASFGGVMGAYGFMSGFVHVV
jgi:hypothetical protein